MAGIQGITDEILQEANKSADTIIAEAKKAAETLLSQTRAECEEEEKKALQRAAVDADALIARANSQAGLLRRQAVLTERQSIIGNVIRLAYDKLAGQDAASYFGMIMKLLEKTVEKGEGEILFPAKDLARLPENFASLIEAAAAKKGGKLTISREAAPIENGFILRYGGIEINNSLQSVFASMQDAMQDAVREALW